MTMEHWLKAILFVTTITAYAAAMWIMLAFARHAHRRILVMLDTGYYWRDAGAILRRESRKADGPRPGAHRKPSAKAERSRGKVEILAIEDRRPEEAWEDPHGEDVIEALKRVDADLLGDGVPHSNVTVAYQRDPTVPMFRDPADLPAARTQTVPVMEASTRK